MEIGVTGGKWEYNKKEFSLARGKKVAFSENMMQPHCRGIIHVVQKGDTLYLLGKKYHVSVAKIMYANPYVDIYNLTVGDELCIPVSLRRQDQ